MSDDDTMRHYTTDQVSEAEPPAREMHQWALALLYVLYAFGFRGEGGGLTIIPEDKWDILYGLAGGATIAPENMHDALACVAAVNPDTYPRLINMVGAGLERLIAESRPL